MHSQVPDWSGKDLAYWRKAIMNWTQEEAGAQLGISTRTVQDKEKSVEIDRLTVLACLRLQDMRQHAGMQEAADLVARHGRLDTNHLPRLADYLPGLHLTNEASKAADFDPAGSMQLIGRALQAARDAEIADTVVRDLDAHGPIAKAMVRLLARFEIMHDM